MNLKLETKVIEPIRREGLERVLEVLTDLHRAEWVHTDGISSYRPKEGHHGMWYIDTDLGLCWNLDKRLRMEDIRVSGYDIVSAISPLLELGDLLCTNKFEIDTEDGCYTHYFIAHPDDKSCVSHHIRDYPLDARNPRVLLLGRIIHWLKSNRELFV